MSRRFERKSSSEPSWLTFNSQHPTILLSRLHAPPWANLIKACNPWVKHISKAYCNCDINTVGVYEVWESAFRFILSLEIHHYSHFRQLLYMPPTPLIHSKQHRRVFSSILGILKKSSCSLVTGFVYLHCKYHGYNSRTIEGQNGDYKRIWLCWGREKINCTGVYYLYWSECFLTVEIFM